MLLQETRLCLSQMTIGQDGELSAHFIFPPEFSGFQGHFPGNPVLPGVCIIQAVLVMLEAWKKAPVSLKSVVSAKWLSPVKPCAELHFTSRASGAEGVESTVKTQVTCGGEKVAEVNLRVTYSPARKEGSS